MHSTFYKISILIGLLALAPSISAQPVPEEFRRVTSSLLERGPKTYQ